MKTEITTSPTSSGIVNASQMQAGYYGTVVNDGGDGSGNGHRVYYHESEGAPHMLIDLNDWGEYWSDDEADFSEIIVQLLQVGESITITRTE